jgi:hypothetical protein
MEVFNMKMQIKVLTVSRYNFTDEKTGRKTVGSKIMYEGSSVNTDTKRGIEVLQINSDRYEAFDHFTTVPGKYEVDFNMVPGKNGQVKMVYESSKLVG